ncbi:hypothetical protein J3R30DRAFT_3441649 [Lentinula aciculospora]|uniref:Thioredoxin domain-containing protein n=1 Tax=Lentinula aciculospora TaxID=153920 RepID=A0A9W9ALL0_9AGAR|nr:hypothetical protein J3R30DRAFT_3441649 [Lentinula aciculospora]
MPIHVADSSTTAESLSEVSDEYLIFYSSVVDGQMWCPDCLAVEELVKDIFSSADAPSALIVYTGDRPTWKSPSNIFRSGPFGVQCVPTIVKVQNGKEVGRLIDQGEIIPGLANFVHS